MNKKSVSYDSNSFKFGISKFYSCMYLLAGLFGVLSLFFLFIPGCREDLVSPLLLGPTLSGLNLITWPIIFTGLLLVFILWSCFKAYHSFMYFQDNEYSGLILLEKASKYTKKGLKILFISAFVVFVGYSIYFASAVWGHRDAAFLIYSAIFSQVYNILLFIAGYIGLTKYLNHLMDCYSILAHNMDTKEIHYPTIPFNSAIGSFIIGLICVYLGFDQFSVESLIGVILNPEISFEISKSLLSIFSGAMLFYYGIGNIAFAYFVKRYKSESELVLYKANGLFGKGVNVNDSDNVSN